MQSFNVNRTASFVARHRVVVPVIVLLMVVSVGFAAAGGIQLVRGWFVTTSINGHVVDRQEVILNEDGSASFTIPAPEIEGDTAVIDMSIEAGAGDAEGYKAVNISLDGGDTPGQAQVTITTQPGEEEDK